MIIPTFLTVFNLIALNDVKPIDSNKLLVFFWGSWCSECKEKMVDVLPDIAKKTSVITVSMDRNINRAKYIITSKNIQIPAFIEKDDDRTLSKKVKVYAVPHWAVFIKKADWELKDSGSGFNEEKVLETLK